MGNNAIASLEAEIEECAQGYVKYCHAYRADPPKESVDDAPFIKYMLRLGTFTMEEPFKALLVCERIIEIDPNGYGSEQVALGEFGTSLNSLVEFKNLHQKSIEFVRDSKPLQSIFREVWTNGLTNEAKIIFDRMKNPNIKLH